MSDPNEDLEYTPESIGPTLARDPMLGAHLGDYVVQERIGAGGMGIVYSGIHPVIGKRVAIKVLQWEAANNPDEAARLKAEARLVNSIGHRGIVDIYDFGKTRDGREYVVMELLSGEPLDKVIADRAPLPVPEVLAMLDEVCDALCAAHGAGVIHRDLKPNNVFYVAPAHGSRYIKLLDFGLAKKSSTPHGSSAQTRASMVVGTPYYMAPEQARAQPVSPQTDLYSLGVMAFELLTGKLPFDAPTPFEVISLHLNAPPPSMLTLEPNLPPALDELVLQMMAKAPGERPTSAAVVRRELQRIRNRLQTDTTNVGRAPRPALEDEDEPSEDATQLDMPALDLPPPSASTMEYGSPPRRPEPARLSPAGSPSRPPMPAVEVLQPAQATSRRTSQPPLPVPTPVAAPIVAEPEPELVLPRRSFPKWLAFALPALLTLGVGGWWLYVSQVARPPLPELAPTPGTEQPETLTPPPAADPVQPAPATPDPPVEVKGAGDPEAKPEPKPEDKPAVEPKPEDKPEAKPEPLPDGKKPRAPGKKVDLPAYRRQLLLRIDNLAGVLESQNDKMELTSAKALRGRISDCATLPECREGEWQLKALEARHR